MFDAKIIAACLDSREAYEKVKPHVLPEDEFTPTGQFWWKQVADWYTADSAAKSVDRGIILDRGLRSAGRNADMAREWFTDLAQSPSPANVALEALELKRTIAWRKLAAYAEQDQQDRDEFKQLVDEHKRLLEQTDLGTVHVEWITDEGLEALLDPASRIPLFPPQLQDATGGILRGEHFVLFGRPESGKTLFAIENVAGWLRSGYRVLYCGNEEPVEKIRLRIRANLSGMSMEEMRAKPKRTNRRVFEQGYGNLYTIQMETNSVAEIEQAIRGCQPDCIVVDQLRNIQVVAGRHGTRAQSMDQAAREVRGLLSKHEVVGLCIGQAHAQEHNKQKLWLDMDDFDESRTGVPGQADLIVGIGYDAQYDSHNQRCANIPKNKLSGQHSNFVYTFDKARSKIL
jgi:KaiC/GvpD/RAD55 family RecA-like ATPase